MRKRPRRSVSVAVFLAIAFCSSTYFGDARARAGEVDFEQAVLPILQSHCIDCHGPDAAEADLRLDTLTHALRGGDSGEAAIVPGASDKSYLIARVVHDDDSKRMPPETSRIDDDEIAILKAWIDDAPAWRSAQAELEQQSISHWSFLPIERPSPPDTSTPPVDAMIDAMVDEKLAAAGLQRSPTANRRTLIRRLYLVMHGLPPTPAEVEQFLNDDSDDAWRSLVDRVLASRHYGERWATHWLDLIRFGETTGFETNQDRPNAWPFRDWVIEAFNSDKPYDRFIIEQIAGDAVGADVATGFLVAGPYDLVKGQDPLLRLMQRQDELADMINTTGTAFLGLTIGCARCHNHKFDPISQTDYYAMQAIFAGVNHGDRPLSPDSATRQRMIELDSEISQLRGQLAPFVRRARTVVTDSDAEAADPPPVREPVNAQLNVETLRPTDARFVRFTVDATNGGEPCIDELEIYSGGENVALASAGSIATSSGDFVHPLHQLAHINDGKLGNDHSWISSSVSGGWVQIELAETRTIDLVLWGRDRNSKFGDRVATDYRIEGSTDGETWTLLATAADRQPASSGQTVGPVYDFDAFPSDQADRGRAMLSRLQSLTAERDAIDRSTVAYAGTFAQPGPTFRLYRGEPTAPKEQVAPAAIKSLTSLSLPDDSPERERRLALAQWIADPENPLTARVIVNRLWQFHFGTGIVDTPSDFGGNGTPPSHPELLDRMASELIRSEWSLKQMHRLILNSETWRQESSPREDGMTIDAASRLLWRFPPRRLEAEGIRDGMLAASGKLDLRAGGPGFNPFEIQSETVRHYFPKSSYGPEDWRRMIYMTKVRQEKDSVFGVFDCPDFSQVVPKRSRSTTPLQALNLLNSRFVLQQADFFVERLRAETGSQDEMVSLAYELCFNRLPETDEVADALEFVEQTDWQSFARVMFNSNEFVLIP